MNDLAAFMRPYAIIRHEFRRQLDPLFYLSTIGIIMPQAAVSQYSGDLMLTDERRQKLSAALRQAGIEHLVLYGNAWQGDYLRYGSDFGILEGHGLALISASGDVELFLDSATDAERAEQEVPDINVSFAPNVASAVGARLDFWGGDVLGESLDRVGGEGALVVALTALPREASALWQKEPLPHAGTDA